MKQISKVWNERIYLQNMYLVRIIIQNIYVGNSYNSIAKISKLPDLKMDRDINQAYSNNIKFLKRAEKLNRYFPTRHTGNQKEYEKFSTSQIIRE